MSQVKTPWGTFTENGTCFEFRPKYHLNHLPVSSDGYHVEDTHTVYMRQSVNHDWQFRTCVDDDGQTLYFCQDTLFALNLQGKVRVNAALDSLTASKT